jgi:hypothetical protein
MKRSAIVFSVLLLCTAGLAEARLGETRNQCDSRYGMPVSLSDSAGVVACVYRKAGFEIRIEFEKRKGLIFRRLVACKLVYSKPDPAGTEARLPLTDGELKALLAANVGKSRWRQLDMYIEAAKTSDVDKRVQMLRDADKFTIWTRDHDDSQAIHDLRQGTFTVRSPNAPGHKTPGTSSDMSGF